MFSGTINALSNDIFVTVLTEITVNEFRYVKPTFRRLLAGNKLHSMAVLCG